MRRRPSEVLAVAIRQPSTTGVREVDRNDQTEPHAKEVAEVSNSDLHKVDTGLMVIGKSQHAHELGDSEMTRLDSEAPTEAKTHGNGMDG